MYLSGPLSLQHVHLWFLTFEALFLCWYKFFLLSLQFWRIFTLTSSLLVFFSSFIDSVFPLLFSSISTSICFVQFSFLLLFFLFHCYCFFFPTFFFFQVFIDFILHLPLTFLLLQHIFTSTKLKSTTKLLGSVADAGKRIYTRFHQSPCKWELTRTFLY